MICNGEMNYRKTLRSATLCSMLFVAIVAECQGQNVSYEIKGIVCEKNKPDISLEDVEVIVSTIGNTNDSLTKLCLTKSDGSYSFNICPNKYRIFFRQFGDVLFQDTLEVYSNVDMGLVPVNINAKLLPEVCVNGNRKMIRYDRDRMIYSVKQSPWAKGFNAKDVVTKMPWADPTKPNELSLVGKDGVILLVNERRINLKGKELINYLQNIPSENIEKIEILTNPSPEFSMEGRNGVINIVTKQKRNLGFEGSVSVDYTQHRKSSFSEFFNLSFSNNLMVIDYSVTNYNENFHSEIQTDYSYPSYNRFSNAKSKMKYDGLSQNLSTNLFLNDDMNIGFLGSFAYTKNGFDKNTSIEYTDLSVTKANEFTKRRGDFHSVTLTPYYEWNIDSLGKKLVVNYNFSRTHDKGHQLYTSEVELPFTESKIKSLYIYNSYNVDLKLPYTWMNFEAGGEYRHYRVKNKSEYSTIEDYLYKESVFSTYFDANKSWGRWYAKVGARYEYTSQSGFSENGSNTFELKYGKLFPFVDITFHPVETSTFVFGYSKRIQRPAMWCIDPTRGYTDSYHYEEGNPHIKPTMMDYFELKYMVNNLYIELSYVYSKDGIIQIFTDKGEGVVGCNYANGLKMHSYGGNANYTFNKNKFSVNVGGSLYYNRAVSTSSELTDDNLKGISSRVSSTFSYRFIDNITSFLRYFYVFPGLSENVHIKSFQSLSMGVNMRFFKDKLNVEIGSSDIFNTHKSRNRIDYKLFTFTSNMNNDNRSFYLKLSYRFGNDKVRHSYVDVNNGDGRMPTSR